MFESRKNAFWQAFLVTILIFGIGIFAGIIIENIRTSAIQNVYQISEVDLLDMRLQSDLSTGNFSCNLLIDENFKFADRIYQEAQVLDKYSNAARLTNGILFEHKKYDVLRAMLFSNSLNIQKKCNSTYHNVLYFYDYTNPSVDVRAKQNVFSKLLLQLKETEGSNVLLIPMAADNELSSVDILLRTYNITQSDLPVIIVDQKTKLTSIETVQDLENAIA